jgi:voltage-gated potassium channel
MSIEQPKVGQLEAKRVTALSALLLRTRRLEAASIDARMRAVMITATLLVIPDLVLEEQPLRASWHTVAVVGDWVIWLVFLVEFAAIVLLAKDWRSWLRRYPLAPAMLVLTPPLAPPALQALRVFRLLRLLRVARGFELLSKLLTLDGLKYIMVLAAFLVVGGGTVFAGVESSVGHRISTWDGIWWAMGTATTEGSNIAVATNAGRAIAIVLMLAGIGVFSIMTGAIAQHFLSNSRADSTQELSSGEKAIMDRLDELADRLHGIEIARLGDALPLGGSAQHITGGRGTTGLATSETPEGKDTMRVPSRGSP